MPDRLLFRFSPSFQLPETKQPSRLLPFAAVFALVAIIFPLENSAEEKTSVRTPPDTTINSEHRAFFENKIRPALVKHCYSCHAADSEEVGGKLFVDSQAGLLQGGESGPAVVAGDPDASLIIQALKYDGLEMPPEQPLPEAIVHDFVKWVEMGAPDPRTETAPQPVESPEVDPAVQQAQWAFQPVQTYDVPQVEQEDWCYDPIDRFLLAKSRAAGLQPIADAAPETLIRRLYFDLVGLPPQPAELQQFVAEYQQAASAEDKQQVVARWVDQLLASPHYGERWGRHWLDVARFGESNGNDGLSRNPTFPHAWRYRDYVIEAFNSDRPYDQFLTEQIAGDLLPAETLEQRHRQLVATGFLAIGSKPAKAMNINFDMDVVADQINVVSTAVMGLSVGCARCHDHKHDPIPASDYYALAGIFTSTETMWGLAANEGLTAPPTPLHVLETSWPPAAESEEDQAEAKEKSAEDKKKKGNKPPQYPPGTALAMGVRERPEPADCKLNIKGESNKLGPSIPRGFLTACQTGEEITVDTEQSGRLQLAQWLTSGTHPQTGRVIVNRVWLHLFGRGLVRTPDDFGMYGEAPTHPKLLDFLAQRFIQEGWSIKRLIRQIVLTHHYQLSSDGPAELIAQDAGNLFYCRFERRRMDAESIRDRILVACGTLNREPGQGSIIQDKDILVNKAGNLHQPSLHRSVYLCMLRHSEPPELAAFNLPDSTIPVGQRDVTTLPSQALFLLNSPLIVENTQAFAENFLATASQDQTTRIQNLYQQILLRTPDSTEVDQSQFFLQQAEASLQAETPEPAVLETRIWAALAQALLMTSEFRYID